MKFKPKEEPLALRMFRALCKPALPKRQQNAPTCTVMRGNPRSRVLIIAPPLTQDEYTSGGIPLSSPSAVVFHDLLIDGAQFSTDENALVLSCCRFGLKPAKASTHEIEWLVQEFARKDLFDLYVAIGDDAFKFVFGRGKKPPMSSLEGQTLYVSEIKRKPLFVFPGIQFLYVDLPPGRLSRTNWRLKDFAEKQEFKFRKLIERFKLEVNKHR